MPSLLSPQQQLCGNSCTWVHDVYNLHWATSLYISTCWQSYIGICYASPDLLRCEHSLFLDPKSSKYWNLGISELRGQVQSFNVAVLLLVLLLEGQKELHEEVKSWWGSQRGLNWQHSNPDVIPQPSYLFWHTILIFVKSNMLISFNLYT